MKCNKNINSSLMLFSVLLLTYELILSSCQENNDIKLGNLDINQTEYVGCFPSIKNHKLSDYTINAYSCDSTFQKHLNQIIISEQVCKCYNPLFLAFEINTSVNENDSMIMIFPVNKYAYDYSSVYGCLELKKTMFFLTGFESAVFKKMHGKNYKVRSLEPKKKDIYEIDDSYSGWFFKLYNKIIIEFDYYYECVKQ